MTPGYPINLKKEKKTRILHDTDLHGLSCGVTYLYALMKEGFDDVDVFGHFDPKPNIMKTCPPDGLDATIRQFSDADIVAVDIPISDRKPQDIINAFREHVAKGNIAVFADHHGQYEYVKELERAGVCVLMEDSSYKLTMLLPRLLGHIDDFVEGYAYLGAVADADRSIASMVSEEDEYVIRYLIDDVWKFKKDVLYKELGIAEDEVRSRGNAGAIAYKIVEKKITARQFIEIMRKYAQPLELHEEPEVIGGVCMFKTPPPRDGIEFKLADLACMKYKCKVAVIPSRFKRGDQVTYSIVIAKYWREGEDVVKAIEQVVQKYADRKPTGHAGARRIPCRDEAETKELARKIAEELAQLLS